MTSKVVGRFRVDRMVGEHPFYVAETSEVQDEAPGEAAGQAALLEAETRVWGLLKDLDALSAKTGQGGAKQIDFDMRRCSPDAAARPVWDSDPPAADRRAELFSWAVVRRLGLSECEHLVRSRRRQPDARCDAGHVGGCWLLNKLVENCSRVEWYGPVPVKQKGPRG